MVARIADTATGPLTESDTVESENVPHIMASDVEKINKLPGIWKTQLVWKNIVSFSFLHLVAFYGIYLMFFHLKFWSFLCVIFLSKFSGLGLTAGAHRYWSHKSYKATWQLRLLLIILHTMTFQDSVYVWARDHRLHHKYSETNGDPHNPKRGVFFSHIGWLMMRKHKDVFEKTRTIDLSDLENDKMVMFQKKYYFILMPLAFIITTCIPVYLWGEDLFYSFLTVGVTRFVIVLHGAFIINSFTHGNGTRAYDKYIYPGDSPFISIITNGEGHHNFHHVFPWDYRSAELEEHVKNFTTSFIDFFASIGWAYDRKVVSAYVVKKRVERTGDGSHPIWGNKMDSQLDLDGKKDFQKYN